MPKITPIQLAEIFRVLSSASSDVNKSRDILKKKDVKRTKPNAKTDEALKQSLSSVLKKLQSHCEDFEKEAPLAAIQEVMLWKFGEDAINDSDFRQVTESIAETIMADPKLNIHMSKLISSLIA
ncbi:hypothetical protein TDB9533_02901 [Thalassocella blandensis]|nr:hypothetical protein TDB9533_02901 [Thalassocella blandensis]